MIPHVSLDFVLYVHKGNITSQKVYRPWRPIQFYLMIWEMYTTVIFI